MESQSFRIFNESFLRYQKDVFAYIVTLVPDRNEAEDVFQQTCVAILESKAEYDPQRRFFPWACGFALNAVRRHRRAHHRERISLSDAVIETLANVQSKSAERIEAQMDLLLECVSKLSAEKQALLMSCYTRRRGWGELAAQFQIEINTLYKRLERIRRVLIECMSKGMGKGD
jgi:RNA polymerase sigma-70 factor (ECF subfamily)